MTAPIPLSPLSVSRQPQISTRPTRLRWVIADVPTRDTHRVSINFACSVAIVDEPADRKLLAEVFGSPATLGAAAVIAHFQSPLRTAAEQFAAAENAQTLLAAEMKPRWAEALRKSANEVGFGCGLEAVSPFDVEVTSPTLQREKLEQMQRAIAEKRSADRAGQFARAADLLTQWDALKTSVPSATPGKLLEQVNPADRGQMLDTLLMASAGNTNGQAISDLWVVSGPSLVKVDLRNESPQAQVTSIPASAGPLRSINVFQGKLMIGARNGAVIADPADSESATVYFHRELVSEFGFTSVTQIGNHLWACHRDAGLVGWIIDRFNSPVTIYSRTHLNGEPKNLNADGLFTIAGRLFRIDSRLAIADVLQTSSPIVAILHADSAILIVEETGVVTSLDPATLEKIGEQRTTGRVTGAALLPWLGSSRLLLNRADGPIDCIGLDDQLLTQFNSGQMGMRAVTACAGKVAAMTSDRQRLLLWNPWDGRKIAAEIYLPGITRHRIADLSFG